MRFMTLLFLTALAGALVCAYDPEAASAPGSGNHKQMDCLQLQKPPSETAKFLSSSTNLPRREKLVPSAKPPHTRGLV
ncbi:DCD isoform 3 [Pan troglodytes]|uniref:DCD isoform 3 n=2 Tax=Homininae TaxID=207598 RepID=A0A2J8Q115_PANTR|nr:dermcidin isoform 1 [Homo sapiens]KAI4066383.1 dermcidin [Homo sapiens]PNI89954.1 DCD isoform 3 [Pan troglodytes]